MKIHVTEDKELITAIRAGLKENDGYCPCVFESRGKEKYKCLCENFRLILLLDKLAIVVFI